MADKLIDYLLGALDGDELSQVEQFLNCCDAETRRRLEMCQQALLPLQADSTPPEVPDGLARRTCVRVREICVFRRA
jgi:hypothetical protein